MLNNFVQPEAFDYIFDVNSSLIDLLLGWKCQKTSSFYDCAIDLSTQMAIEGFWAYGEVDLIKNWFNDLTNIGYPQPKIVINPEIQGTSSLCVSQGLDGSKNRIYSNVKISLATKNDDSFSYCHDSFDYNKSLSTTKINSNSEFDLNKKLTVVIQLKTNRSNDQNDQIALITNLYNNFFENIIFCGTNRSFLTPNSLSYIYIELDSASYRHEYYYCLVRAIQMGYKIQGMIWTSEDVFIRYSRLGKFDREKIWLSKGKNEGQVFGEENNDLARFLKFLEEGAHFSEIELNMIGKLVDSMRINDGKTKLTYFWPSNGILYLPFSKFYEFSFLASLFIDFQVSSEIAVSRILNTIVVNEVELVDENFLLFVNSSFTNEKFKICSLFLQLKQ